MLYSGRRPAIVTAMTRHRWPLGIAARASASLGWAFCTSRQVIDRSSKHWTL